MGADSVVHCARSMCVQGSIKLVVFGMLGGVLGLGVARFCVLLRLKYQDGAVKVIGAVLDAVKMRTSSAWYPWRSWIQRISVSVSGSMMMLSRMMNLMGMVLISWLMQGGV